MDFRQSGTRRCFPNRWLLPAGASKHASLPGSPELTLGLGNIRPAMLCDFQGLLRTPKHLILCLACCKRRRHQRRNLFSVNSAMKKAWQPCARRQRWQDSEHAQLPATPAETRGKMPSQVLSLPDDCSSSVPQMPVQKRP